MEKVKILLVDDHEIVHDGIRMLLRNQPQFDIVHAVFNGEEALAYLAKHEIDLVVSDISMPKMDGITLTAQVKKIYPSIQVLVLTVHKDKATVHQLLEAEADGYLLKNTGTKELVEALTSLANGETFYAQEIVKLLMKGLKFNPQKTPSAQLSPRESEILQLVADEYTTKVIAEKLFISPMTVDTHRKNILKKTGQKTIIGLIKFAILNDLVVLNQE